MKEDTEHDLQASPCICPHRYSRIHTCAPMHAIHTEISKEKNDLFLLLLCVICDFKMLHLSKFGRWE